MSLQCVRVKEEADWECGASEECVSVKEERQCEEYGAREECGSGTAIEESGESAAVLVKEEREWDGAGECGASEAAAAGLYADHEVKGELVLGPEQLQPRDIAYELQAERKCNPLTRVLNTEHKSCAPSNEDCNIKLELAEYCVKVEDSGQAWDSPRASTDGVEAEWAGLYDEHEVKHELVLGPERLQPQDIAYTLAGSSIKAAKLPSTETPVEADGIRRPLYSFNPAVKYLLRPCVVRLERITDWTIQEMCKQQSTLLSRYKDENLKTNLTVGDRTPGCDSEQFICDICRHWFADKNTLVHHIQIHSEKPLTFRKPLSDNILNMQRIHGAKELCCDHCKKQFSMLAALKRHQQKHTSEKSYQCHVCGKQFSSSSSYSNHKQKHTGRVINKPYKYSCDICKKQFKYACGLKNHEPVHSGEKHRCDCGKEFSFLCNLQRHKRSHTDKKPYTCDICKKQFTSAYNVKEHTRTHTGEKPYQCDVCKKQFSRLTDYNKHKKTHTGTKTTKPYSCEICKKQFTYKYRFIVHTRTHTGEKPYNCEVCKKQFADVYYLKRHKLIHEDFSSEISYLKKRPFACEICKKRFTQMWRLKRHEQIHTGEKRHACEICKKTFFDVYYFNQHKLNHAGEIQTCDICKKQFSSANNLKEHKRIHTGEQRFPCDICPKMFSRLCYLERHIRCHMGEKPYTCDICKKRFSKLSILRRHIRTHT